MTPPTDPSSGIFISYRREDTAGFAGRLYDRLAERFGATRVFMDIDTIKPGQDFANDIDTWLVKSGAFVVLIGRQWETVTLPDGRRRLEDPGDFVRLEVAAALRRGTTVFPVLVERPTLPAPSTLPDELRPLTRKQAIELTNDRWNYDVGALTSALEDALGMGGSRAGWFRRLVRKPAALVGVGLLLLLAVVFVVGGSLGGDGTPTSGSHNACREALTSLGNSPGAHLCGTYHVGLSLDALTGDLGGNDLLQVTDPEVGSHPSQWADQSWLFSVEEGKLLWTIAGRQKWLGTLNSDGSYDSSGGAFCGTDPRAPVKRHLEMAVAPSGAALATSFQGSLTISWRCQGEQPVVATFSVTGDQR